MFCFANNQCEPELMEEHTKREKKYVCAEDWIVLRGARFYDPITGAVNFTALPDTEPREKFTVGGPAVITRRVMLADSAKNLGDAIKRVTGKAHPYIEGVEKPDLLAQENQKRFVEAKGDVLAALRERFATHCKDWRGVVQEALEHASDPHEKRLLRMATLEYLKESGIIHKRMWSTKVQYKSKKREWAKMWKRLRAIGDMSVAASLETFRSAKFLKNAMAKESFVYKGIEIQFCAKPSREGLREHMARLANPPRKGYFVYFSDDSCYSRRCSDGKVRMWNVDISSCDASHKPALFSAAEKLVPENMANAALRARHQCYLPIEVINPQNRTERILLQPTRPRLYSGHGWTTYYNNVANLLIALSLADAGAEDEQQIRKAAFDGPGYRVTCETADPLDPRQIQFLKCSPVNTASGPEPVMNFAVFLRTIGVKSEDYIGPAGQLEANVKAHNRAFLEGLYMNVDCPFLRKLKAFYRELSPKKADERLTAWFKKKNKYKYQGPEEVIVCSDADFFARYDLEGAELEEMMQLLLTATPGHTMQCTAMDKILKLDYGLEPWNGPCVYTKRSLVLPSLSPHF